MKLAEFVAKLQEYPQDMEITLHGSEYWVKILGFIPKVESLIVLFDSGDHEEPIRWADTKTLKIQTNIA